MVWRDEVRVQAGIAYPSELNRRVEDFPHTSKLFISVQRWSAERSRVDNVAKVLVQWFRKNVQVLIQESPIELSDEFDFGGVVAF